MSDIGKFSKDIVWFSISNLLQSISGLLLLPLITKSLGAYQFGIWAELLVIVSLFSAITTLGMGSGVIRFLPGETNLSKKQDLFYSTLSFVIGVCCIAVLFILIFSNSIAQTFFNGEIWIIFFIPILLLLQSINEIYICLFKAFREMRYLSFILLARRLIFLIFAYFSVTNGYKIQEVVIIFVLIELIIFCLLAINAYKIIGIKYPSFDHLSELLKFSAPLSIANIIGWIISSSDKLFIGFFLGLSSVGYYTAAYSVGIILTSVMQPVSITIIPIVSKYYDEKDIKSVEKFLFYPLKYFLLIAIPSVFGLIILSDTILTLFTTLEIAQNSIWVTPIICCAALFGGCQSIIQAPLFLEKKTHLFVWFSVFTAALSILLNIILIPLIGILGAALGALGSVLFPTILMYHYANRCCPIRIDWGFVLKCLTSSVCMALALLFIESNTVIKLIFTIIIGIGIYFVLVFAMKGMTIDEIKQIFRHIRHS